MNLQPVKQAPSSAGLVELGHKASFLGHCLVCGVEVRDDGNAVADLDGPAFAAYCHAGCATLFADGVAAWSTQ